MTSKPLFRSVATKVALFSGILVIWVIGVVLAYDIHIGQFDPIKTILLAIVTILVTGAMARFTLRMMVGPLLRVRRAIQVVADGDLTEMVIGQSGDEIELLGHSFNLMVRSLESARGQAEESRQKLEKSLREVTEQLAEAKRLAASADRTSNEVLVNLCTELRTPVSRLARTVSTLQDGEFDSSRKEQLRSLDGTAHKVLELLSDVLDLAKMEAGRLTLEQVPFEVEPAVEACIKPELPRAVEKGLSLTFKVDRGVPRFVSGDPARFRQILSNLVSNAVTFTSHGAVNVQVMSYDCDGSEEGHGKPHELMIVVSDTGPGIPASKRQAIFEKFVQADESISRKHGGCGLGLAIAKRLVELHHGSISLDSELQRGSQFTVLLPYEPFTAPPERTYERAGVPAKDAGERAVLLVEDNVVNQKVVTAILRKHGYQTEVAVDGQKALDLLAGRDFALVLMDVQMPVMDGLEATRRIRSDGRWEDLPIVAMTAHAMSGDRERCLEAGMNGYLPKPVNQLQLLSVVARYCPSPDVLRTIASAAAGQAALQMRTTAR